MPFVQQLCMILHVPAVLDLLGMEGTAASNVSIIIEDVQLSFQHVLLFVNDCILHCFCLVAPTVVEPITPGCSTNSDCPDYTACRNTQCINPCAVDAPCAPTANCKVISHQPVCTCPDGFIGSPTTECRLRKMLLITL